MIRGKIKRRMKARCGGNITPYTYRVKCGGYLTSKSLSADGMYATFNCSKCGTYTWGAEGTGVTNWWNQFWQYYTHCQNETEYTGYKCDVCGTEYNATGKCTKGTKKRDYLEARVKL